MATKKKPATGGNEIKRVITDITLHIDPLDGIMAAATMERFLPVIIDTFRPASKPEALEILKDTLYNVVDELATRSLERVGVREALKEKFDGIEVI